MRYPLLIIGGLLLIGLSTTSCRKSSAKCGTLGWSLDLQNEITNLSNASSAYSLNPTTENCKAYKEAYSDYIDALRGYEKCVSAAERAGWQQSLDEAEADVNNIQC